MRNSRVLIAKLLAAVAVLAFSATELYATAVQVHMPVFVSAGGKSTTWDPELTVTTRPDGIQDVNLANPPSPGMPIDIKASDGTLLAQVDSLGAILDHDPAVSLNFAVTAGAADTTFTIMSPVVGFPGIANPQAFATATATLTDQNGGGATMTGLFSADRVYEASYNGGSVFADLVLPLVAAPDDSTIGNDRFPAAGRVPIAATVSSIQSEYGFTLSALDSASGTSRFDIVPEPSSFVLAALGFAALVWHKRRRK
jgi:hypothetical protein